MKDTYYIFKEEDLKRVGGPVQNEWDKPAIFKQELLDILKICREIGEYNGVNFEHYTPGGA